jgi:preprotein translocase subunit SecF
MEFFGQANINWMGKAKYFVSLSLLLLAIGAVAMIYNGGPTYGIDFKGGTLVTVPFAKAPDVDSIRKDLTARGLGQSTIQAQHDITNPSANNIVIGLEETGTGEQALDEGKAKIIDALRLSFPSSEPGKQDFNFMTASQLTDALLRRDPLGLGISAGDRYKQIGQQIAGYRDKTRNGVIADLGDLNNTGVAPQVVAALRTDFYAGPFGLPSAQIVGPKVGSELRKQAVYVTLYALGGMLLYIAIRFTGDALLRSSGAGSANKSGGFVEGFLRIIDKSIFGTAAVVAVFHDVLITLGLFSLFHRYFEISLTVIAALLTLVGYSMNDTIVIFDRIRENSRLMRREPFPDIVNRSINQTLSRTILTSGLTFLTVLVLFIMGGPALRSFSFALVIGIVVGTYSSFGIAAPLVVAWNHWRGPKAALNSGSAAGNKPGQARRVPA